MEVDPLSTPPSINAWESNLLGQMVVYLTSKDVIQLIHTGNKLLTHKLATCTKCFCIRLKLSVNHVSIDSLMALITERLPNLTHLAIKGTNPDEMQCCFIQSPVVLPKSLTSLKLSAIWLNLDRVSLMDGLALPNVTRLSLKSFQLTQMGLNMSLTDLFQQASVKLLYLNVKPSCFTTCRSDSVVYTSLEIRKLPLGAEVLKVPQASLLQAVPPSVTRLVVYETTFFHGKIIPIPPTVTDLTLHKLYGISHMDTLLPSIGTNPLLKKLRIIQPSDYLYMTQSIYEGIGRQFPSLTTLLLDVNITVKVDVSMLPKTLTCVSSHLSFFPDQWCHFNRDIQFARTRHADLARSYQAQRPGFHHITPKTWPQYSPYLPTNLQAIWCQGFIPDELIHCQSIVTVGVKLGSAVDGKSWSKCLANLPITIQSLHIHITHTKCCMPWFDRTSRSRLKQLHTITFSTDVLIFDEPIVQWCRHLPSTICNLSLILQNTFHPFLTQNEELRLPPLRALCRHAILTDFKIVARNYRMDDSFIHHAPESVQYATIIMNPVFLTKATEKLRANKYVEFGGAKSSDYQREGFAHMRYRRNTSLPFKEENF